VILATAAAAVVLAAPHTSALALKPCVVQAVDARCGSLVVPENRAKPTGRKISLNVVVIPSRVKPARPDAFAYLAGGPGGAATDNAYTITSLWSGVHARHDILLVDQRGTGRSNPLSCPNPTKPPTTAEQRRAFVRSCLASAGGDVSQYGTRTAMDDLDAVRAALGYRQLDLYGASYGATAAQMYLKRHPASVRTVVLDGGTAIDVPFYGRFAANAQQALAQITKRCAADTGCTRAFAGWPAKLSALIRAWDKHPAHTRKNETTTGAGLAGVIQNMLLDANSAVWIPLLVSHAAKRDYAPLNRQIDNTSSSGGNGGLNLQLMFWSIWCNEPWVGLNANGPWHTDFDSYTTYGIASYRTACTYLPKRAEPADAWTFPHSQVPVLALAGGADPQDPIANLPKLKQALPNSRAIVLPYYGHTIGQYGCLRTIVAHFVNRGSAKNLDTSCIRAILPPPIALS
jgi:pimeloyl-ACP methyl ester carboxylesterase